MFSTKDFNPYQPPRFVESVADDELADGGIFVPSWGSVIANAALVSTLLGVIAMAAGCLPRGNGILPFFILTPLSFSWYFCRTYRLPYRNVPKFGWLPLAFVFVSAALIVILTLIGGIIWGFKLRMQLGLPFSAIDIFDVGVLSFAAVGASLVGILCLAMDFSMSQYVSRKSNPKMTLLIPVFIGFMSILFWLPVGYIQEELFSTDRSRLAGARFVNAFMFGCAFATAVFYSLIMAHPAVFARLLFAKSDPRRFTKREFQL